MIEHVFRRIARCPDLDDGFVATCDQQNMDAVNAIGGNPIMTSSSHQRVSERVAESIDMLRFIENGCKVKRVQTAHRHTYPLNNAGRIRRLA
jgi:CMP-2-keto-3-deoxyoctulosonic acid synthetase